MILYLHGFRSSPHSQKARLLAKRLDELGRSDEFLCPQLPVSPSAAAQEILQLARTLDPGTLTVIGSSLGGYYATWLAEQIDCRAVLLNPAVRPQRDLGRYLGPQTVYYSEQRILIRPEFLDELEHLWVPEIRRPERFLLIAAKGDEVLDWREMVSRYPGSRQLLIEGGDHGLSDFDQYLDSVLEFARGGQAMLSRSALAPSVERVARALAEAGLGTEIVFTSDSTRTAAEAAAALGVTVAQIAKSLIFRTQHTQRAVLVIAAGDNRVDEAKVGAILGEPIERADAKFVRNQTGFVIGGVAPVGHSQPLVVLCDATLARFERVWAAAGSPHAVFPIAPVDLYRLTGGKVVDVKLDT
jgi:predicted esterase YcpF (UPF0227 family)/prolyl-tRNA editing enzyme YbaK/EbsC (Cys-tRNA(Pro) deacylase)